MVLFPFSKDDLITNPKVYNLCNLLKSISYDTWRRIEFVRNRKGLKILETTITQNILYSINMFSHLSLTPIPITIYEAENEAANGNDIELVIRTVHGIILAPLQAKLLKKDNRYNEMKHNGQKQIDDLINYAQRIKGIPLYLLYNYYPRSKFIKENPGVNSADLERLGCSLVNAHYLKTNFATKRKGNWQIPAFKDLHPSIAKPLDTLGCFPASVLPIYELLERRYPIHYHQEATILKDPEWHILKLFRDQDLNPQKNTDRDLNQSFSPKFRIVLDARSEDFSVDK